LQVYPDKDMNNIVESNHYMKIGNWCKLGRKKCKSPARWVKPFRCLGKP
jgi:amyloid beta A4 protein